MTEVILVDEEDVAVGVMEKMEAHQKGILHRAFSIFIFNRHGEMLLQQRADGKYHSAGLWTNACCSHPAPGETINDAAHRRLKEEMGFETSLQPAFRFTYKSTFENGLTEHEFDHVLIGQYDSAISPDAGEVSDYTFVLPAIIKTDLEVNPTKYTSWFKIAFPKLEDYLAAGSSGGRH